MVVERDARQGRRNGQRKAPGLSLPKDARNGHRQSGCQNEFHPTDGIFHLSLVRKEKLARITQVIVRANMPLSMILRKRVSVNPSAFPTKNGALPLDKAPFYSRQ
jgi:hypothetical protein